MKGLAFLIFCNIFILSDITIAIDIIPTSQSLYDGDTLVSCGQTFELGFFTPVNSKNRYLGIWYKNIPDIIVWVANRNSPLTDTSGFLKINDKGNILLLNGNGSVFWSTSSSRTWANPIAHLLESGNFVIREWFSNSESYSWQSFDYPCDTLLPGMKLGLSLSTKRSWNLSSWIDDSDPSSGGFTYSLEQHGLPEFVLRKGSKIVYRSGSWDGVQFRGLPELTNNFVINPIFIYNASDVYFTFENIDKSTISRFVVNVSGSLDYLTWNGKQRGWNCIVTMMKDICDNYAECGAYGVCTMNGSLGCKCMKKFTPRSPQDWHNFDPSAGCVRNSPLNCSHGEGFIKLKGLKLPDSPNILVNESVKSAEECKMECLANCSCMAYAATKMSGCITWFGDLTDIREYTEGGQDFYIRLAASELDKQKKDTRLIIIISAALTGMGIVVSALICFLWRWRKKNKEKKKTEEVGTDHNIDNEPSEKCTSSSMLGDNPELPIFDSEKLATATNGFHLSNKLGKGGFGTVYKGKFPNGQEIAVKRLSKSSGQGSEEFMNEVVVISKLQHRNLVKLVGCCIEGEEKMLVYEYLPNKGLDSFLFDPKKQSLLDWRKRFQIIEGIGRGTLYLHRDSRLRVIHRDLKASNILLDEELNPKISDFGMARIFGGNELQADTLRVVGTYGYMSPEYAMDGRFSEKSDVFSFGILLLEIVSGKRNTSFSHHEQHLSLLGYAWKLWNEDNLSALIDPGLSEPCFEEEILRCIHVGLLCVQDFAEDRPTMSIILSMLSEIAPLPLPKQPAFTERQVSSSSDYESRGKSSEAYSMNYISYTDFQGR